MYTGVFPMVNIWLTHMSDPAIPVSSNNPVQKVQGGKEIEEHEHYLMKYNLFMEANIKIMELTLNLCTQK